jgi:hypothetical protein
MMVALDGWDSTEPCTCCSAPADCRLQIAAAVAVAAPDSLVSFSFVKIELLPVKN